MYKYLRNKKNDDTLVSNGVLFLSAISNFNMLAKIRDGARAGFVIAASQRSALTRTSTRITAECSYVTCVR